MKVKILHIAPVLAGVETAIRLLAAHLDENLFEIVLIKDAGGQVEPIKYTSGLPVKTYLVDFSRPIQPLKDAGFLRQAMQIARQEKPHLIHCHSAKCGIIGRTVGQLLSIPTFFTPQAFSYLSAESKRSRQLFLSIERLFSKTNNHLIACSESEAQRALQEVGYPAARVHVVNNALPGKEVEEAAINSNLLCTIGRPSFQKNTFFLLQVFNEAVKYAPDLEFTILGVGHFSPDLKKCQDYIEMNQLTDKVKIVEWTSRKQTLEALTRSSVYLSASRYEGLSFAVLEALSLGKPCLLSNTDGNKDCVEDGENGYLFEPGNTPSYVAGLLIDLLKDADKLTAFGLYSRKLFEEKFHIEKNIKELEKLYLRFRKK